MKKLILYIVVLFGISCQKTAKDINILAYFDTEDFVKTEINEILDQNFSAEKQIELNGKTERLKIEELDSLFLKNEFKILKSGNINKPALLGFYRVDSSSLDQSSWKVINYSFAEGSKSNTKQLKIVSDENNDTKEVYLVLAKENFMHAYYKEVNYISKEELTVKAWEKTMFKDTLFYNTKLTFTKD